MVINHCFFNGDDNYDNHCFILCNMEMNHCFIWGWIVTPMNCRLFLGMKIHLLAISWCSHTSTRVLTHSHKTIQNGCSTIFWYTWNYLNIPDVSWYNHQKTYCTNNLDVQWCGWFLAPSWRTTVIKRERIQSGLDAVTNPDWRCSPEGNRPTLPWIWCMSLWAQIIWEFSHDMAFWSRKRWKTCEVNS